MRTIAILALCFALSVAVPARAGEKVDPVVGPTLERVAAFVDRQVTGVAVSEGGRLFVNFPRWSDDYRGAVAEVLEDGTTVAYPDSAWNALDGDPAQRFVCVQSVVADGRGSLWVLDPAAPFFQGPVEGGPKLVRIDLETDQVLRVYRFGPETAPLGSYLNDVRVDLDGGKAYMTDSNQGAIVVLELFTGASWRVLDDHPSTRAEEGVVPEIGGEKWQVAEGQAPEVHSDGIALSPGGDMLYYHALTGYHLYRVPTKALWDLRDDPAGLGDQVEDLGEDVVTDGMILDAEGNLYYTALELSAVVKRLPDGELVAVVKDERLRWPDSLAWGPDGALYVTTSQIHLQPQFQGGLSAVKDPYGVWRIDLR